MKIYPIFKKELKSYFVSPVAYIVLTVFLLISGWFFSSSFFLINQATLREGFNIIPIIFIFFAPAITMRLISEEKKSRTIEILVTMPVRDSEIVLGKFFAALTLLSAAVLLTVPYAIIVSFLGDLDWGPVIGGYVGLILMGAAYVAIGLFASSLTENQVIAFIIALLFVFILFMLNKILIFVPQGMVSILEYLSIEYHFTNISRGVIDSRDIIYYLSLIIFTLLLAIRGLGSRRWR